MPGPDISLADCIIFKKTNMDGTGGCGGSQGIYGVEEDEIAAKVKAEMKRGHSPGMKMRFLLRA